MSSLSGPGRNLIRFYRERRWWTQLELATRAGFSERLIRKVERGHSARPHTLEVLAETLSVGPVTLTAADLRADPVALAQAFVRGCLQSGPDAAAQCAHLLHPDVVLVVHADPTYLAFGGAHHGLAGIDRMIRTAHALFEVVSEDAGKWFADGPDVAAVRRQVIRARRGGPDVETFVFSQYTTADGLIKRIDHHVDASIFLRLLDPPARRDTTPAPPPTEAPAVPHSPAPAAPAQPNAPLLCETCRSRAGQSADRPL